MDLDFLVLLLFIRLEVVHIKKTVKFSTLYLNSSEVNIFFQIVICLWDV